MSHLSRGRFARTFRRHGTNGAQSTATAGPDSSVQAGHNAWRIERADRATVLVDAASYYGALRSAIVRAKDTIYIAGWDINSRTPLVGESGEPEDDLPECLGDFLTALVQRRPSLSIRLLLWDFSVVYLLAREMPTLALQWKTPRQIELCLDDDLPTGSCHHQKIVVVDDEIAFSGGLDLTIRRWDCREHRPLNVRRTDPAGVPYPPFHDVQILVDGPAAKALGSLFREPRFAIEAIAATARGPLHLTAVHLGLTLVERRRQADMLAHLVKSAAETFVMLGDFNEWPWHDSVRRRLSSTLPGVTRLRSYHARFPLLKLDRVYCRPRIALLRSWTDPSGADASDHLPVFADIRP